MIAPPSLYKELADFAVTQVTSRDIDPLYPVLRSIEADMDNRQAMWYSLLYVAYYNIASSDVAFQSQPVPGGLPLSVARLPTGTERRNLRGGRIQRHVVDLVQHSASDPYGWLRAFLSRDPWNNWHRVTKALRGVWGNGRWACYKTCEVLQKVNDFPLRASDMGNAWSSGPRKGLAMFYEPVHGHGPASVAALDQQAASLQRALWVDGIPLAIEELETILCDFHSMSKGKYYSGHDIDEMQHVMEKANARPELWAARKAALPNEWLGELKSA